MINATLTSVTGGTKVMGFATKENLIKFIDQYAELLPIGKAVNIVLTIYLYAALDFNFFWPESNKNNIF